MKVLMLAINASWTHSCLAAYYLRNAIRATGHETKIIEITLKHSLFDALEAVYHHKPDVLCLSVYIWNISYIRELLPELKKLLPSCRIVLGGPEVSFNDASISELNPDYIVKGYGEIAFHKLAMVNFSAKERIIMGEYQPLSAAPFPYLDCDRADLTGKMLYYEASRGCACKCVYCLSSRDDKLDWLPIDVVLSDIDNLITFHPKVIKFVDRCFNLKKEWSRAIWQYVISLDTDVPFHFEVHPDWLEPEDIELLSTAPQGRIQLEIGIQSIHDDTLDAISRPSNWVMVKQNLILLRNNTAIPLHVDLIAGLPGESARDIQKSVNEVLLSNPHELQLGFLKVLQGTVMADIGNNSGYQWLDIPPYQVIKTPDLPFVELIHLEKIADIINQYWNKGDFVTVWEAAIKQREPYICLEELLHISLKGDGQLHSIDRLKRFDVMAGWIELHWEGDFRMYLFDALRWDWCRKAGEAWFPPSMKADHCLSFRKEHYPELYEWLKTEYWENTDWNFKRFTTFSVTSNDFAKDYLNGYSKAAFINRKSGDNACVILTHLI